MRVWVGFNTGGLGCIPVYGAQSLWSRSEVRIPILMHPTRLSTHGHVHQSIVFRRYRDHSAELPSVS